MRRIRTDTLIGDYSFIDAEDEALDRTHEEFKDRYQRALETGAIDGIPLKNGTTDPPTIWRFRHLTTSQQAWLGDHGSAGMGTRETMFHAVQLALVAVANVVDEQGKPVGFERERLPNLRGWNGVLEDDLNRILDGDVALLLRLGVRVMNDSVPRRG